MVSPAACCFSASITSSAPARSISRVIWACKLPPRGYAPADLACGQDERTHIRLGSAARKQQLACLTVFRRSVHTRYVHRRSLSTRSRSGIFVCCGACMPLTEWGASSRVSVRWSICDACLTSPNQSAYPGPGVRQPVSAGLGNLINLRPR